MRRIKKPFAVVASICLLMLQLSGAHVHANEGGYIGIPEVSYNHTHGHHHDGNSHHRDNESRDSDRDRDQVRDLSLLDPALSIYKMPLANFTVQMLLVPVPTITVLASADVVHPVLSGRYTRWRPPLRAPPLHA